RTRRLARRRLARRRLARRSFDTRSLTRRSLGTGHVHATTGVAARAAGVAAAGSRRVVTDVDRVSAARIGVAATAAARRRCAVVADVHAARSAAAGGSSGTAERARHTTGVRQPGPARATGAAWGRRARPLATADRAERA